MDELMPRRVIAERCSASTGASAIETAAPLDGSEPQTYAAPEHGWTCFHCGETFPSKTYAEWRAARDHFGWTIDAEAACQIKRDERELVFRIRCLESHVARYAAEDSDKDREMHGMRADHQRALQREEEKGYERGLADGRLLWRSADDPPAIGGTYDVGGYVENGNLPRLFVRGFATFIVFEDGPKWMAVRGGDVPFNVEYWFEAPYHPEREHAQRKASARHGGAVLRTGSEPVRS